MTEISTTAEAAEDAALPRVHLARAEGASCADTVEVPEAVARQPVTAKSPARWAYERLVIYLQNFEKGLDAEHELAMGFTGAAAGVMRIEGIGYFDPDIVTFYGTGPDGMRSQLVQHVGQLNVMLRAMPKPDPKAEPMRIGFRLARDIEAAAEADTAAAEPGKHT